MPWALRFLLCAAWSVLVLFCMGVVHGTFGAWGLLVLNVLVLLSILVGRFGFNLK